MTRVFRERRDPEAFQASQASLGLMGLRGSRETGGSSGTRAPPESERRGRRDPKDPPGPQALRASESRGSRGSGGPLAKQAGGGCPGAQGLLAPQATVSSVRPSRCKPMLAPRRRVAKDPHLSWEMDKDPQQIWGREETINLQPLNAMKLTMISDSGMDPPTAMEVTHMYCRNQFATANVVFIMADSLSFISQHPSTTVNIFIQFVVLRLISVKSLCFDNY